MHCPLSQLSQTVLERGFVLLVDLQASDFKIQILKLGYAFEKYVFVELELSVVKENNL